jgi:hypothetical protein
LWHPKWQTFEKSPSKKSNTKIKPPRSPFIRLSPDPITLIFILLGQNNINSPFATVLLFFDGDFSKVCHLGCHKSCLRRRLKLELYIFSSIFLIYKLWVYYLLPDHELFVCFMHWDWSAYIE